MGLSFATTVTGFLNDRTATNLARKLQKYRNQMSALTGAMNERAINLNEIATKDAAMRMQWAIAGAARRNQGASEVAAAAAGTSGRNVDSTMRGLRASEQAAQAARRMKANAEMQQHHTERVNNRVNVIMNRDITVHQKPSLLMAGMGLAAQFKTDFDNNQPEGDKLGDRLQAATFKDWWAG